MAKYFGLDKIVKLMGIIKQHGGIRPSLSKLFQYVSNEAENYATKKMNFQSLTFSRFFF